MHVFHGNNAEWYVYPGADNRLTFRRYPTWLWKWAIRIPCNCPCSSSPNDDGQFHPSCNPLASLEPRHRGEPFYAGHRVAGFSRIMLGTGTIVVWDHEVIEETRNWILGGLLAVEILNQHI